MAQRYKYASRLPGNMAGTGPFADCSPGIQAFQQKKYDSNHSIVVKINYRNMKYRAPFLLLALQRARPGAWDNTNKFPF